MLIEMVKSSRPSFKNMIQTSFNAISTGATGMFGRQVVLYVRHGKLIIAKAPRKRPGRGTPGQERTRADFSNATAWSAKVRGANELKAHYLPAVGRGKNVHNLAISDYLVAPEVHEVYVEDGNIIVHATDNFQVVAVKVMVYSPNGELMEAGLAGRGEGDTWLYRPGTLTAGCNVVVVANDLPGNTCRYEIAVSEGGKPIIYKTISRVARAQPVAGEQYIVNTG
jgi:hypothetical protein